MTYPLSLAISTKSPNPLTMAYTTSTKEPKLMSAKTEVIAWTRKEEYSTVQQTASKAPCWVLLYLIHIPDYRADCKLVIDDKRTLACAGGDIRPPNPVPELRRINKFCCHVNKIV